MLREIYEEQFKRFCQMSEADGRFMPTKEEQLAVLDEDTPSHTARDYDWTYLTHCSWAARALAKSKPRRHVDIGGYVYFAGLCSAFIPQFEFYDIRALDFPFGDLKCGRADLTDLPFPDNSIPSLSCLHVLDHIGLGRYGDTLDAKGDIKAAKELARVLAPGGELLIVLPMDEKSRIAFNAHRLLSFKQATVLFEGLNLSEFTMLYEQKIIQSGFGFPKDTYTGCFVWTKL